MISLRDFPLRARRASGDDPALREFTVPFGSSGYIILFEVVDDETLAVLAIRHQREDDFR
ncbi:type II toxin-antitoxin system RelE/ParE family toxin [Rhizobium sp. G187]|uniref:type II toxin-antitoxin system RelE/ParE family toxin n=1 Tax=Rhizobium sp. G187 TaxID=3451352 RepID=UPI003EE6A987